MSDRECIDHMSNRRFLNIPKTRKFKQSREDHISSLFGTVSYGDFEVAADNVSGRNTGEEREASLDYEFDLKTDKYWLPNHKAVGNDSDRKEKSKEEMKEREESMSKNMLYKNEETQVDKPITSGDDGRAGEVNKTSDRKEKNVMTDRLDDNSGMSEDSIEDMYLSNVSSSTVIEERSDVMKLAEQSTKGEDMPSVRSNMSSAQSTPFPTFRVRKPPGGDCSDVFNQNNLDQSLELKNSTVSRRKFYPQQSRTPWGTEDDLKKLPMHSLPSNRQVNGLHPSSARLGTPSGHVTETPLRRSGSATKFSTPYGTDDNFTAFTRKAKHANHRTETPWATEPAGGADKGEELPSKPAVSTQRTSMSQITF